MQNNVIAEEYTLPSKGKVYMQSVNPNIQLRSMTTNDEMRRLGKTDRPYKLLSEIIDDCLISKPGISSYDMCIADFQYLLHKLRVVTYGADYNVESRCPICGNLNKQILNLESLIVSEFEEDMEKYFHITLPVTQKNIELRLQSPRLLDDVNLRVSEVLKKSTDFKGDPAILYSIMSVIAKVDDEVLDPIKLESFVRNLPMRDTNYIRKSIDKINIGINSNIDWTCSGCGGVYVSPFPITTEFYGPSID